MAWEQRNLKVLLPDAMKQVSDTAAGVSSSLQTVVDILDAALKAAQVFATPTADPTSALITALQDELEDIVNDTFGTGFFQLIVTPYTVENPRYDTFGIPLLTPGEVITTMSTSFDDAGDSRRPQFSDSANVTGFGIIATAPDATQLLTAVNGLLSVLNLKEFQNLKLRLDRAVLAESGTTPVRSIQPDWSSVKLEDIPGFSDIKASLVSFLNQIRGYQKVADAFLDDFLSALTNKVNAITNAVDELNKAIQAIEQGLGATGVYWLNIPTAVGGNTYLKQQLPDSFLSSLTTNGYSAGALYVAGGPSVSGLEALKDMLD